MLCCLEGLNTILSGLQIVPFIGMGAFYFKLQFARVKPNDGEQCPPPLSVAAFHELTKISRRSLNHTQVVMETLGVYGEGRRSRFSQEQVSYSTTFGESATTDPSLVSPYGWFVQPRCECVLSFHDVDALEFPFTNCQVPSHWEGSYFYKPIISLQVSLVEHFKLNLGMLYWSQGELCEIWYRRQSTGSVFICYPTKGA